MKWSQIVGYELSDWAEKSLNSLFTVPELRFFRYHVCTIKVLFNKRVCDHVTYSISIGNSFQPCGTHVHEHMWTTRELLFIWQIPPVVGDRFKIQHGAERVPPSIFKLSGDACGKHVHDVVNRCISSRCTCTDICQQATCCIGLDNHFLFWNVRIKYKSPEILN